MCFAHPPAKEILGKTKPKGVSSGMRAPEKNTEAFLAKTKRSQRQLCAFLAKTERSQRQKGSASAKSKGAAAAKPKGAAAAKSKGAAAAKSKGVASPVTPPGTYILFRLTYNSHAS